METTSFFKAAYFQENPSTATSPSGGPFDTNPFDSTSLSSIHTEEY